jgi:hypothetical protein
MWLGALNLKANLTPGIERSNRAVIAAFCNIGASVRVDQLQVDTRKAAHGSRRRSPLVLAVKPRRADAFPGRASPRAVALEWASWPRLGRH